MRILALDQGSSSSRALVLDGRGRVLRRAQVPLATRLPGPGRVEHDPEGLWRSQRRALELALRGGGADALAVATQRSTVVFWDARTGKGVGPALSWQDGRAAEEILPLQFKKDLQAWLTARTGLLLTPYYSAPKIAWALKNLEPVRRLADAGRLRLGPVGTFLLWKLTGGAVFAVDPTLAQRTLLFDIDRLDWDPELLRLFGVPRECLPEVRPTVTSWGEARVGARRLPIRALVGDQQAAALGLGVTKEGEAAVNYGTGAFLLVHTGVRRARIPGILTSVGAADSEGRLTFLAEGTVHAAATTFEWLADNLRLLGGVKEVEGLWRRSRSRVWCLPAIGGLGAPRWDYRTPSCFFGLDSQTRREDLVRGAGEAVAFLITDIAAAIRGGGFSLESVRASGGLSRVPSLVRFQADLLQVPLRIAEEKEVTALGAASLAGAAVPPAPSGRRLEPGMGGAEAQALHKAWTQFVKGVQRLARTM